MKLNVLYGVLTHLLTETPEFKLFDEVRPIPETTLEGKEYYRLTLPPTDIAADGFKLHEAHMSIYEKIDPSNPTLGPSHFTAVFHDSDGREFRMHLFLNRSDILACSPTWERLDERYHYVKVEPPASMGYLTHSIWQQGLRCLRELRQQQKNLETKLINDYERLDQQTSSYHPHLSKDRSVYLESLEELIKSVKLITQISNHSNWPRKVSYLRKLQKNMSSMPESRVEPIEKKQPQKQGENEGAVSISSSAKQRMGKKNQHQEKPNLSQHTLFSKSTKNSPPHVTKIQKQINMIEALFNKLDKTLDNPIKALLLIDLNNQLLAIDLEKVSLTNTQIETLSQIEAKVTKQAKSLLQMALLNGEYDFTRTLSQFYNLISSDIFVIALTKRNVGLVEFLAKDLRFPIHSYPITTKEKTYSNAIEYCFSESKDNDSILDCFSVLIKQGASLMQPVGPDKLPLAHLLLSAKPKHPLYVALEQNKNLTLNNQQFYSQLISELTCYLRSGLIEEDKKKELESWVVHYEQLKINAEHKNLLLNPGNQALLEEISEIAKKFLSDAMVDALEKDKDILEANNYLLIETKELINKIKLFKRKTGHGFPHQSIVNAFNQEFKNELIKNDLQVDIGFSELKNTVLQSLNNARLMVSHCMESIHVMTQMTQCPRIEGKRNKRFKTLESRLTELSHKIEELNKSMPHSIIKKYNELQENLSQLEGFINNLNNLKEGLTVLGELLNGLGNMMPSNIASDSVPSDAENELTGGLTILTELFNQLGNSNLPSNNVPPEAKSSEDLPTLRFN